MLHAYGELETEKYLQVVADVTQVLPKKTQMWKYG